MLDSLVRSANRRRATSPGTIASIKVFAVLATAKLAGRLSRLLRRGGGQALPGLVADRLMPQIAFILGRQLSQGVIVVTGTNGKTTTTKLLGEMLATAGECVVSNRDGSNMKQGVLGALIAAADWRGVLRGNPTIGLFEVDEATVPLIVEAMPVTDVLVTNLFRDQLDRYGDLETIAATIGQAIQGTAARVFLNADDPMVASLSQYVPEGRATFFGVQTHCDDELPLKGAVDSVHCPKCATKLDFGQVFYSHLGHYSCPGGDFMRPDPWMAASGVTRAGPHNSVFDVKVNGECIEAHLPLGGLYNVYNALAALAVAIGCGISPRIAVQSLSGAEPAFGRMEEIIWDGRILHLVLIKNPTGCTQVLETFLRHECDKTILVAINDLDADGRDVSWLWDVPFECLADRGHRIIATGSRAYDVGLRLHYGGIASEIVENIADALDDGREGMDPGDTAYLLTTYTAMYAVRKYLSRVVR